MADPSATPQQAPSAEPEGTQPVVFPRPDPDDMPPLMTIRQAARILGNMPERTVRLLCEAGTIYAVKIGRQWRVNRDDLYRQYRIRSQFLQIEGDPAPVRGQTAGSTLEAALL